MYYRAYSVYVRYYAIYTHDRKLYLLQLITIIHVPLGYWLHNTGYRLLLAMWSIDSSVYLVGVCGLGEGVEVVEFGCSYTIWANVVYRMWYVWYINGICYNYYLFTTVLLISAFLAM